jgi:hypothetical protein
MISAWFAAAVRCSTSPALFGGNLPKKRARLIAREPIEITSRDVVLTFPKPHRPRRRAMGSRQLSVVALDDYEAQPEHGMLAGPQGD